LIPTYLNWLIQQKELKAFLSIYSKKMVN
jgi:hypothetical protein